MVDKKKKRTRARLRANSTWKGGATNQKDNVDLHIQNHACSTLKGNTANLGRNASLHILPTRTVLVKDKEMDQLPYLPLFYKL